MYYQNNHEDPYMRTASGAEQIEDDDSDLEEEGDEKTDMTIREDDLLIVCTKVCPPARPHQWQSC